ncbi:MAG: hypothetical protein WCP21_03930, partial [Armatimonadota bacterium]
PGEVNAWATALPFILQEKAGAEGLHGGDTRFALPKIEARCAEVLEGMKSDKQRAAEAKLAYLQKQRERASLAHSLNSNSDTRQRAMRLRGMIR